MRKYLSRLLALLLTLLLLIAPASALTVDQALELLEELYYYDIPDEAYQAETVDELDHRPGLAVRRPQGHGAAVYAILGGERKFREVRHKKSLQIQFVVVYLRKR